MFWRLLRGGVVYAAGLEPHDARGEPEDLYFGPAGGVKSTNDAVLIVGCTALDRQREGTTHLPDEKSSGARGLLTSSVQEKSSLRRLVASIGGSPFATSEVYFLKHG